MAIKAAIRSLLIGEPTISSLISTRVYNTIAGTKADLPHLVYNRSDSDTMSVQLNGASDLRQDRFNFQISADTQSECENASLAVRDFLEGSINVTSENTLISRFILEAQGESTYYPEGREKPIYETTQSWEVTYYANEVV